MDALVVHCMCGGALIPVLETAAESETWNGNASAFICSACGERRAYFVIES